MIQQHLHITRYYNTICASKLLYNLYIICLPKYIKFHFGIPHIKVKVNHKNVYLHRNIGEVVFHYQIKANRCDTRSFKSSREQEGKPFPPTKLIWIQTEAHTIEAVWIWIHHVMCIQFSSAICYNCAMLKRNSGPF